MDKLIDYNEGFESSTKEDLITTAQETIRHVIEEGYIDERREYAKIRKALLFFEELKKGLEPYVIDEINKNDHNGVLGVRLWTNETGARIQYDEDHIIQELEEKLKARKELLKTARKMNEQIYDEDGILVPRVNKKEGSIKVNAQIL